MLNQHQQAVFNGFLDKIRGGMEAQQFQKVESAIRAWDQEQLVSHLDSLNHSAPEARINAVLSIYTTLGLRDVLKEAGVSDERRLEIVNKIAGSEVAQKRTRPEG